MHRESLIESYNREGCAVVRGLWSKAEISAIDAEVRRYLERKPADSRPGDFIYEDNPEKSLRCAFRLEVHSDYFRSLMQEPRIIRLVEQVCGGAVVANSAMLINKAPLSTYEFPFHQDNAYQFWSPPAAVAVTLALDESSAESGAIVCLAGSHVGSIRPHRPSGVLGASRGLVAVPRADEFPEVTLTLNPGDVSFHHVNVIHRTGPNRTRNQRRNLGFAYHAVTSVQDKQAVAEYELALKKFLQTSSPAQT